MPTRRKATTANPINRDAFEQEIIKNKLLAIADEMLVVLTRTSMSPIVYEILDCSTGVTDAQGRVIAQTDTNLVFTAGFSPQIESIVDKFGLPDLRPGDVFMTNVPDAGASHLTDVCVVQPVFYGGRLVAFGAATAHWADVGGKVPGSLAPDSTEIYQEGLQFPGIRVVREGQRNGEVIALLQANVRLPQNAMGDLNAEMAATSIADMRLQEMFARYSPDVVNDAFEVILDYGERLARAELRKIPNGVYEAEDYIDGDGLSEQPIPVRVAVTIDDDAMTVDFTGSAPQAKGSINCSPLVTKGACKSVLKAITNPGMDSNDGCFRPLSLVLPLGTVFSAQRPAPVSYYLESFAFIIDLVWHALAPVLPEKLTAGNYTSCCATLLTGLDNRTGKIFVDMQGNCGGWGAGTDLDGQSGLTAPTNGDFYNIPVEVVERNLPVRIEAYRLNTGTGAGAGKRRGGLGLVREYRILSDDAAVFSSSSGWQRQPWGVDGGHPGSNNFVDVHAASGNVCHGRVSDVKLTRGDLVRVVTGCGGGYGDPFQREAELVFRDWRDGYITLEDAKDHYGVVIDPTAKSVDPAATGRLRANATAAA